MTMLDVHKDIRHINNGKSKTILYVYFIKQKLFGYSPSSVLTEIKFYFLH